MSAGFVDGSRFRGHIALSAEVCVIGSGAGGAVTAATLAAAGKDVLLVEEGDFRTRADFNMREDVAFRQLYQEGGLRFTGDVGINVLQGRVLGGSTVINWTTSFRTPDRVLDHWRANHAVRGFTAADLAPHFDAVEERLNIRELPLSESNRNNRLLYDGARAIGLDPRPTRRNTRGCVKSGYCGMGCPIDAKQSTTLTYLPDAVASGARVIYGVRIDRLEGKSSRVLRARGVPLLADHRAARADITITARRFVLSAGGIGSPAILLRSGLGGGGTMVGRRTFLHPVVCVTGRYADSVEPYYGAPQSVACHSLADRGPEVGLFLEAAPLHPMLFALASPGFGPERDAIMRELPRTTSHIALAIDGFHPSETGGRVQLRPSGAPRLEYKLPPRVMEALREGLRQLVRLNLAAGAEVVRSTHDPPLEFRRTSDLRKVDNASFELGRLGLFSAHVMGGCAMGDDPVHSVVRSSDLRHHGLENLHVVDGSVFPTSLGVNPAETIFGLARLVSTRLAASW